MIRPALLAALVLVPLAPLAAQEAGASDDGVRFAWSGPLAAGKGVRVTNVNGRVEVVQGSGAAVAVRGTRTVRRGDGARVRYEVLRRTDGDLVVCVLWPGQRCTEEGGKGTWDAGRNRDLEVRADVVVEVPAATPLEAFTVNGDVVVAQAGASVRASSVNGDVTVDGGQGRVAARTVNGSVTLRPSSAAGTGEWAANTVNGSVEVALPADAGARVDLATVNGRVRTDAPITVTGELSRTRLRGTIGSGGRDLRAETVNGNVTLSQRH